tara:strand:- start:1955 stop:2191 length:237 start_codon:yes stop_codon:yes gene_type:complete
MPIPIAAQCCLLYSALAPAGVYGTVLLPALFVVENEAGPVLVVELRPLRLVSVPSMMKMVDELVEFASTSQGTKSIMP